LGKKTKRKKKMKRSTLDEVTYILNTSHKPPQSYLSYIYIYFLLWFRRTIASSIGLRLCSPTSHPPYLHALQTCNGKLRKSWFHWAIFCQYISTSFFLIQYISTWIDAHLVWKKKLALYTTWEVSGLVVIWMLIML